MIASAVRLGVVGLACLASACASVVSEGEALRTAYATTLVARFSQASQEPAPAAPRLAAVADRARDQAPLVELSVRTSLAAGDFPSALVIARRADPSVEALAPSVRLTRAAAALAQGRWRAGSDAGDAEFGDQHDRLAYGILRAWMLAGAGRTDAALTLIERTPRPRGLGASMAVQQAALFEAAGRDEDARARYAEAERAGQAMLVLDSLRRAAFLARTAPGEAVSYLAELTARSRHLALAQARVAPARLARPLTPQAGAGLGLAALAEVALQDRDPLRAVRYAGLALIVDPDADAARLSLGAGALALGQPDLALRHLGEIPQDSLFAAAALQRRMWALADLGRTQEAVRLAQDLAARPPQAAHAAAYGELMVRLGLWEEADAAFTRALQAAAVAGQDPEWRLLFARGAARNELARWPEAEADLLAALPSAPNDPELLNYLGYSWVERGERLEEALEMIQRAVLARPGSGAIVDSLGWAYFQLGEFEQATAFLERAVELEPADPLLNDHLGDAYWRTGRRLEARLQWRRALSLSPGEALRLDLERKLEAGLPEGASEP